MSLRLKYLPRFIIILILCTSTYSCTKYLQAKPNIDLEIPSTAADLQSILNNVNTLNRDDPQTGQISCDDYYVIYPDFETQSTTSQQLYEWDPGAIFDEWSSTYKQVYYVNTVLDNLNVVNSFDSAGQYNFIKGQALFFRGYEFYNLSQIYAPPYNAANANLNLGICLRLNSNVTDSSVRSTVKATYDQIINDLTQASELLPIATQFPTTPCKTAAFAALARVYLSMQDYQNAQKYSDSALSLDNTLMNYNALDSAASGPFSLFNAEVIFQSGYNATNILGSPNEIIDSTLIGLYNSNDLRLSLLFGLHSTGGFYFKGDYTGADGGYPGFAGLATDEMYLIRSESKARDGDLAGAMSDLNTLLVTRWASGTFTPYTAADSLSALGIILTERRKELVFRDRRWSDLRRLNQDPNFAITLYRNLNGTIYSLPPNDLRYTALIPLDVISMAGIQQNPR
jgi:starch-binding outer membrane protein, SusD/RagB family